jgi:parallel beta-helix repeat protein
MRGRRFFVIAVVFLGILVGNVNAQLADAPWPMFRHDLNNTGQSQYNGPRTNSTKWGLWMGGSTYSSPVIGPDGIIYVPSAYLLHAVYPNGSIVPGWPANTCCNTWAAPAIASDGTIYQATGSGNSLKAFYPNGTQKWDIQIFGDDADSSPAIAPDGTIYVGSYDYNLYAIYPNGTKKWNYTTGDWVYSSPAIAPDGTIYVGSDDYNLYAIYPNGTKKWNYTTDYYVLSSPAIAPDGTIYVGSDDKNLYAIYPNGTKKWNYTTTGAIYSSPAIGADGTVYISPYNGRLYALNPDGTLLWDYNVGGHIFSSPVIDSYGNVYIGGKYGGYNLYAFGGPVWNDKTQKNYDTIQEAVDNATAGDTIRVAAGTYTENVVVNKSLNIIGDGIGSTIIKPANASVYYVFNVTASSVNISGFTVNTTGGAVFGFRLYSSNYANISDNYIIIGSANEGITAVDSNYTIIDGNTILATGASSSAGIDLGPGAGASHFGTISRNTITGAYYGIFIGAGTNNAIYDNYLNNSNNFQIGGAGNTWNTTNTTGTNIAGGPYIGGNLWAYPNGTGFGDTCNDLDSDGFCDTYYTLSAGNIDHLPLAVAVGQDFILPTIIAVSPQNTSYVTSSIELNVSADETTSAWWYQYNGNGTNITFTPNTTFYVGSVDGLKSITIWVNDTAGNENYTTVYFTTVVPPEITIISPQNTTYATTSIELNVSANENIDAWLYSINGTANVTFTPNTTIVAQEGLNNVTVHANDSSGNWNFTRAYFTIDITPPTITSGPNASSITTSSATINWTTNEESDSKVEYGITTDYDTNSGGSTFVTGHSLILSGLASSTTYHYRAISKDEAGNNVTSEDYNFTTPALTITSGPSVSSITPSSAIINWTTNEKSDSTVEYGTTTDYGDSNSGGSTFVTGHSVILADLASSTTYHYRAISKDAAENNVTSGDYTFTTLTPPPRGRGQSSEPPSVKESPELSDFTAAPEEEKEEAATFPDTPVVAPLPLAGDVKEEVRQRELDKDIEEPEAKGICGPTLVTVLTLIPFFIRRKIA